MRATTGAVLVVVTAAAIGGAYWVGRQRPTTPAEPVRKARQAVTERVQRAIPPAATQHVQKERSAPSTEQRAVAAAPAKVQERATRKTVTRATVHEWDRTTPVRHAVLHATDSELAMAYAAAQPAVVRTSETIEEPKRFPKPVSMSVVPIEEPAESAAETTLVLIEEYPDRESAVAANKRAVEAMRIALDGEGNAPLGPGPVTPDEPLAAGAMRGGKTPLKYYFDPNGERAPGAKPAIHWANDVGAPPFKLHLGGTGMPKDPEGEVRRIEDGYEVTFWVKPVGKKRVYGHLVSKDGKIGYPYNWQHGPGFTPDPSGHNLDFRKDGTVVPYDGSPD